MKTLSLAELLNDAPVFVSLIKQGEEVELTDNGSQLARVIPARMDRRTRRPAGLAKGEFSVPKDFNAPLPEHIVGEFEGA